MYIIIHLEIQAPTAQRGAHTSLLTCHSEHKLDNLAYKLSVHRQIFYLKIFILQAERIGWKVKLPTHKAKPWIWGLRTRWKERGLSSLIRSRAGGTEALAEAAGRERSGLIKASCNSQVSATENQKRQNWRAETYGHTQVAHLPGVHLLYTSAGSCAPLGRLDGGGDRAGIRRSCSSGAGAAPRWVGVWAGGELRPGPKRSAVQLQGQRRRLLTTGRLSQVAAFGGRGVLRSRSGLLLPPPRPPRAPGGFAPRTRATGPAGGGRGRSAPGRVLRGPHSSNGRREQPRSRPQAPVRGRGGAGPWSSWVGPPPSRPP